MQLSRRQSLVFGLATGFNFCAAAQDNALKNALSPDLEISKHLQHHLIAPRVVGKGLFSVWGLDIYQATLWGGEKMLHSENWQTQRLALELRYARDFDGKDIAKRSIDEIHAQSPLTQDKAQAWLNTLEGLFPSVRKNHTLTGIYLPAASSPFLFNDKVIGSINDAELVQRFFAIWLSPKTSAPKLRRQLLGGTSQ